MGHMLFIIHWLIMDLFITQLSITQLHITPLPQLHMSMGQLPHQYMDLNTLLLITTAMLTLLPTKPVTVTRQPDPTVLLFPMVVPKLSTIMLMMPLVDMSQMSHTKE